METPVTKIKFLAIALSIVLLRAAQFGPLIKRLNIKTQ